MSQQPVIIHRHEMTQKLAGAKKTKRNFALASCEYEENLNQATISPPDLNMPVTQSQQQVYTDFSSHVIILWSYSR